MRKLRAQQITIETPEEGAEPWVHVVTQEVEKDAAGKVTFVSPRTGFLHKTGSSIGMDQYEYFDPLEQTMKTISGYALQMAISAAVVVWMQAESGGTVVDGDLIVG